MSELPISATSDPFAALVDSAKVPWISTRPGSGFKILRVSEETGAWTALIRADAGTVNPAHKHLGPADFFVLSGCMEYRGGTAIAGCWVYEAAGAVHAATSHPEDTLYLANVDGPIAFFDEEGQVTSIFDGLSIAAMVKGNS